MEKGYRNKTSKKTSFVNHGRDKKKGFVYCHLEVIILT